MKLMLQREIIAANTIFFFVFVALTYVENCTKYVNALCGPNVLSFDLKPHDTFDVHVIVHRDKFLE